MLQQYGDEKTRLVNLFKQDILDMISEVVNIPSKDLKTYCVIDCVFHECLDNIEEAKGTERDHEILYAQYNPVGNIAVIVTHFEGMFYVRLVSTLSLNALSPIESFEVVEYDTAEDAKTHIKTLIRNEGFLDSLPVIRMSDQLTVPQIKYIRRMDKEDLFYPYEHITYLG